MKYIYFFLSIELPALVIFEMTQLISISIFHVNLLLRLSLFRLLSCQRQVNVANLVEKFVEMLISGDEICFTVEFDHGGSIVLDQNTDEALSGISAL